MQIINNKISIVKGETPTYDAFIIEKDGSPIRLIKPKSTPIGDYIYCIEFVVRPSIYNRESDFVYRSYHKMDVPLFASDVVIDYNVEFNYTPEQNTSGDVLWTDGYVPQENKKEFLFRRTNNNVSDYRYYDESQTAEDGTHWIPYTLSLTFQFPYDKTSKMEAKTYQYEITLFGGLRKQTTSNDEIPLIIDFKRPLLEATDFKVGGTLSE